MRQLLQTSLVLDVYDQDGRTKYRNDALGQLSASYPTSAKLEAASGLPVIGSISQMLTQAQRDERKRKLRMYIGSGGALVGVFLVLLIIEFIQRGSVV